METQKRNLKKHDHTHELTKKGNQKSLLIALAITLGIMVIEALGGWITNSLALLSDAGHMLSDAGALALSLAALWFAGKPASANKSYGYYRFEILAALFNGLALFVIAFVIIGEAYRRFWNPPAVASESMMLIAFVGLVANLISAWVILKQGDVKDNLNLRSAYLHILGDALGSVGAIIAGLLMYFFGWYIADPIISIIVSILILKSAWSVVNQTVHILLEGTPGKTDLALLRARLAALEGVVNVHDLHVWTVSSGYEVLTCHMIVKEGKRSSEVLSIAIPLIEHDFGIRHVTIQVVEENADMSCWGCEGGKCTFAQHRKLRE